MERVYIINAPWDGCNIASAELVRVKRRSYIIDVDTQENIVGSMGLERKLWKEEYTVFDSEIDAYQYCLRIAETTIRIQGPRIEDAREMVNILEGKVKDLGASGVDTEYHWVTSSGGMVLTGLDKDADGEERVYQSSPDLPFVFKLRSIGFGPIGVAWTPVEEKAEVPVEAPAESVTESATESIDKPPADITLGGEHYYSMAPRVLDDISYLLSTISIIYWRKDAGYADSDAMDKAANVQRWLTRVRGGE